VTGGPRIAVVDYGMGNRRSVEKALLHVGARASITADHSELSDVDALVVPGVGAFPVAMGNLRRLGLARLITRRAEQRTPILGICLGMQLLFERSEEIEPCDGLGLIGGQVTPLQTCGLRLPHIGWNEVRFERPSPLTSELPRAGCPFYHVHSLAARPRDRADVIASTEYGERFATIVSHERVFGVQFHPEKSSLHGLQMLRGFVELARDCASERVRSAAA